MFTEALLTVVKMEAIKIFIDTEEMNELHYIHILEYDTVVKLSKTVTHNNINNLNSQ